MKKSILNTISKFKGSRGKYIPEFLSNIHISDGMIYCTDNRSFAGYKVNYLNGSVGSINTSDFQKILGRGDVSAITINDNKAFIEVGAKKFTLFADMENVVKLPERSVKHESKLIVDKQLLGLKSFVSNDDLRPAMTGVYFDKDTNQFVATDAHKMKWIKTNFDSIHSLILDKSIFNTPAGEYKAELLQHHLYLENENFFAYIYLLDERYPAYKAVIPDHSIFDITIAKTELKDILDDAIICANPTTNKVSMEQTDNELIFESSDVNLGNYYKYKTQLYSTNNTDSLRIGFNIKFMSQILSTIEDADIKLSMTLPSRAIIVNDNILVMPVQLNEK